MKKVDTALLVIDMSNDFILKKYNPNLALERAIDMVPRIRKSQEFFLEMDLPIIYATDRHLESDLELMKWGAHSMKGTKGSEIIDGLIKENVELIERKWSKEEVVAATGKKPRLFDVEKGTYSAFTDNGGDPTALSFLLQTLGIKPGDSLVLTGLHANCCVKHTAAEAWFRGYEPVMVKDCLDSFDDPDGVLGMDNDQALRYEKYWYNARIMTAEEIMGWIKGVPPAI